MLADTVGWRGGFLALACGSVICFLVVFFLLTPERRFVRATDLGSSLLQMVGHLRNPRLLAIYAVGFGVLFNFIATFTYLAFHLAAPPFNRSPAFLGSIFVVYLIGAVASLWLGKALHDQYQPYCYHIGDAELPPHWKREELNQVLWKFLAEHGGIFGRRQWVIVPAEPGAPSQSRESHTGALAALPCSGFRRSGVVRSAPATV